MKRGRPSDYQSKYCQEIVAWMAKGFSVLSFAGKIHVEEKTIYNWTKSHPYFLQSIKRGKTRSMLYWEQVGMLGMMGKIPHWNATAWIFQMKNRFGWSDRLTVDLDFADEDDSRDELETDGETSLQTLQRLVKKYGHQFPPS